MLQLVKEKVGTSKGEEQEELVQMSIFGLQQMELKNGLGKEKFHPLIDFSNPNRQMMKLTKHHLMNVMFSWKAWHNMINHD